MITFDNLAFIQDHTYPHEDLGMRPKYNAAIKIGRYIFSVVYGGCSYGDGDNSYELAVVDHETDEFVQIREYDNVLGWQTQDEINHLMSQAATDRPLRCMEVA